MFELRSYRAVSIPTFNYSIAIVLRLAVASMVAICLVSGAEAERRADLSKGRALAERLCGRCHAIDLDDTSKLPLAPPFRTLAARYSVWGLGIGGLTVHFAGWLFDRDGDFATLFSLFGAAAVVATAATFLLPRTRPQPTEGEPIPSTSRR